MATDDANAIRSVLKSYEAALNASSTEAVMPLYDLDGVFMDCFSPSAVGAEAIRNEYDKVFRKITLSVRFDILEVTVASPDWAFARPNSAGTVTVHATGKKNAEGNQKSFVFHKDADSTWKFARYCFAPTNPPEA
jgi:uncharacterized protein (TIGR02246 family)